MAESPVKAGITPFYQRQFPRVADVLEAEGDWTDQLPPLPGPSRPAKQK